MQATEAETQEHETFSPVNSIIMEKHMQTSPGKGVVFQDEKCEAQLLCFTFFGLENRALFRAYF